MISLLLAILFSSVIFVIFKLFDRFGIDTFQAIVFNYFMALACGLIFYGHEWKPIALEQQEWLIFAVLAAFLFISLFVIMGISSQKNGVAITSVAVKMSMAASVFGMIFLYNEKVSVLKIVGIALAFAGVIMVSWQGKSEEKSNNKSWWMLLVLFAGSGILDLVLNYTQGTFSKIISNSLFSAIGFGLAGIIGLIILGIQIAQGKARFEAKNLLAGFILGIPNFFSIFLLMKAYGDTGWSDSTVLAVINVSIVSISAFLGLIAFKEKISLLKGIGIISSLLAIFVLYAAN